MFFVLLNVPAAHGQIFWRVSVKLILDANGNRPSTGDLNSHAKISAMIDDANVVLQRAARGYQLLHTETVDLSNLPPPPASAKFCYGGTSGLENDGDICTGSPCGAGGTCRQLMSWFDTPINSAARNALRDEATNNAANTFAWRTNAINIYIVGYQGSGTGGGDMVLIGQKLASANTPIHELGHFFSLCHTDGCQETPFRKEGVDELPGDDEITDTLPDYPTWDTEDQISTYNFGMNFNSLDHDQKKLVNDVLFNIMSHHDLRLGFTPGQSDRMTDDSNKKHNWVASGRTIFVDKNIIQGEKTGTSGNPFRTIDRGVNDAEPGDIVLIHAGTYSGPLTITKGISLRASRGVTIIGSSPP